jgi:hypothetical protein
MSTMLITPTNIDDYDWIFRNPVTGKWTIPVLEFNPLIPNPFYLELDPLNSDPRYHNRTIDYFHTKLTEKWLYKDPMFKSLLKYFHVSKKGDKGGVSLITDPEKLSKEKLSDDEEKYVLRYIEKFFITRRFVEKVLREYVAVTHIKWYDLYSNTDTLKDLFRHKLKKMIVKTIYSMEHEK